MKMSMFHQLFKNNLNHVVATVAVYGAIYIDLYHNTPNNIVPASHQLYERVNLQAQKMGVKAPLKVYVSKTDTGQAVGINAPGRWNSAAIILNEDAEQNHNRFIMSHEIAHVKNNDYLKSRLIALVGFHLCCLDIPLMYPIFFMWGASLAYIRYAEKNADKTAVTYVSNTEAIEMIGFFSESKQTQLNYRNARSHYYFENIKKKLEFSSSGELLFRPIFPFIDLHPSWQSRIHFLEKWLEQHQENEHLDNKNMEPSAK